MYCPIGHSKEHVKLFREPLKQVVQFVPITEQVKHG
jgi:hypothetical protein